MGKAIFRLFCVLGLLLVQFALFAQDRPVLVTSEVPVQTLLANSQAFNAATVQVQGRLRFAGRNYFVDPVFVIEDPSGNRVRVSPWLPLEVPPPPPDVPQTVRPPMTMRDFLGSVFTVQGVYSATGTSIAVSSAIRVEGIQPDGRSQAISPWNKPLPTEAPRRDPPVEGQGSIAAPLPASRAAAQEP